MRYSSGIIKPDGVKRNLQNEIFNWMELSGLRVVFQKVIMLSKEDVLVLYNYCCKEDHYATLENFITSGPVVFYVVFSDRDAVESLNRLVGSTNPREALKETIRGKYGKNITENVIHSVQNLSAFKVDIEHFLKKKEIINIFLKK